MKNYWKQFVEWAIDLRANHLASSRAWLVAMYLAVATASIAIDRIVVNEGYLQALLLLIIPCIAYFLAKLTTRPMKEVLASQRRFIANASHELRTPLAIMKASSEIALMQKNRLTLPEAIEALESNQEEIDRMSARIKILLRIVNFDSNMVDVPYTKVDIVYLIHRVLTITDKQFPAVQNLNLSLQAPKTAFIRGNSLALEELIVNLLRNAIKYTASGGSIDISVQVTSTQVRLRVEDTGIGIPRQELSRIFEPFYRTPEAKAYSSGGSGLGLALVKEIVKQHRAKITVQSIVGKGTAFTVVFPVAN